ncbi:ABC transporter permease [Ruegeria halocynthiae]|uniref:ABC transporter permease n=1 Tax=Ruegeria halocynthiae TaxID=985054 RepID=UPI00068B18D1|nr:ABC transporter permease [Ruegeria halocynthiae]
MALAEPFTAKDKVAASAKRRNLIPFLGLPAVAVIVCFMVGPMLIALSFSFLTAGVYGGVDLPFTIEAYRQFLFERNLDDSLSFDNSYLVIYGRTILLAGLTVVISIVIGLPTAWYMATRTPKVRERLVLLVTIPFWTSLLVRTYCWVLILRDQGLANGLLREIGLITEPLPLLYSYGSILFGLVYSFLPFMILPIYAALEKVDFRLIEAAYDLYASRAAIFLKVVLPLAKPGVIAGSMLVFAPSVGSFLAPDLLGGGKKLMIGSLIQMQFTTSRNWSFGAACAMLLMAVVLTVLVFAVRQSKKERHA